MKIVCFYSLEWEKEYIQDKLRDYSTQDYPVQDYPVEFIHGVTHDYPDFRDEDAEIVAVFVDSRVDKNFLSRLPNLKLIATRSTGYDHIDMDAVKEAGITVCSVPLYGKNTVAEYAFGLILMLARKLYESYTRVRKGDFSRKGLCGIDLQGKTLGVVGTGDIGSRVVQLAHAFGMKIVAFDIKQNEELVKKYGCEYISLEELLAVSDIVTLHVPENKATHHMINLDVIKKMKKGVYIINTARGGLVDTEALVYGLKEEIVKGAALDVLEIEGDMTREAEFLTEHPKKEELETILANHYFIQHPHVIVTAHNAFNTYEARVRMLDCTIDNIKAFSVGKPINVVECY